MFSLLLYYARRAKAFRRRHPKKPRTSRLFLECLEDRFVPSTFVVNNLNDSGTGSLRWAITSSNAATGQTNNINFNLGTDNFIVPASALPAVTNPVVIDGTTNPHSGSVEISGAAVHGGADGLTLDADGCTVRGLFLIKWGGDGLVVNSNNNNIVGDTFGWTEGNHPGPNGDGIAIEGGQGNTIGGTTAADANVIAGNHGDGLIIDGGDNNFVIGNFIGTNTHSAPGLGNGLDGIHILDAATLNHIGLQPSGAAAGNVISGNGRIGVEVSGAATNTNLVGGNEIGTNQAGTHPLGNGIAGVMIDQLSYDNVIGGGGAADANVISGNGTGVVITAAGEDNFVEGNMIGTNAGGTGKIANTHDGIDIENGSSLNGVLNNVISGNKGDGVAIFGNGTTGNVLTNNMIGTSADGSAALPNGNDGVELSNDCSGNTIGGTSAAFANVISGNDQFGVAIDSGASGNRVQGNLIGVNKADTKSLGHQQIGVDIYDQATGNFVGTTSAETAAGNVISGNSEDGVGIFNGSTGNFVLANQIGTDQTGMNMIANGQYGVDIDSSADDNHVGSGTDLGVNIISGNGAEGVFIGDDSSDNTVSGNLIGVNANQSAALPNGQDGVDIEQSTGNVIGGPHASDGNVISGNGRAGVVIFMNADQNYVVYNFIGVTAGSAALMPNNGNGVYIGSGCNGNFIGNTGLVEEHTTGLGNVISGNKLDGVMINGAGANSNTVEANEIGTNEDGTTAMANGGSGVVIEGGADYNTIGANVPAGANVISGNSADGVVITGNGTMGNQVEGNEIGMNRAGTAAQPNGNNGLAIAGGSTANVIGGTSSDQGNLISGNAIDGIELRGTGTDFNRIWNNAIGTAADLTTPMPNEYGIFIFAGASDNTIGGIDSGNLIADNTHAGVAVKNKNTLGDTISQNSIFGNGGLGIDLGNNGITPNGSGPFGPNMYQNYPVLSAGPSAGTVTVTLSTGMLDTSYTIEFFSSASNTPGQGQNFLGSATATTNSSGVATFVYTFSGSVPLNATYPYVTATATDGTGDTSEFSAPIFVSPAGN